MSTPTEPNYTTGDVRETATTINKLARLHMKLRQDRTALYTDMLRVFGQLYQRPQFSSDVEQSLNGLGAAEFSIYVQRAAEGTLDHLETQMQKLIATDNEMLANFTGEMQATPLPPTMHSVHRGWSSAACVLPLHVFLEMHNAMKSMKEEMNELKQELRVSSVEDNSAKKRLFQEEDDDQQDDDDDTTDSFPPYKGFTYPTTANKKSK